MQSDPSIPKTSPVQGSSVDFSGISIPNGALPLLPSISRPFTISLLAKRAMLKHSPNGLQAVTATM
jgi:hypothetical protein